MVDDTAQSIRATLSSDKMSATLSIPPDFDKAMLAAPVAEASLREAGVEVTQDVREAVQDLVEQARESAGDKPFEAVVAKALPLIEGVDGYVEWTIDQERQEESESAADDETIDFRQQSAFLMVKPGQVVGTLHPPTIGEDGRDVTGKALLAKTGREYRLDVDESLLIDANGSIIVQDEGVLEREGRKARVRRRIEIPGYVDFNTGNIDFNGDVIVGRGVRDCFVVKAAGDVEVSGLIEAATIEASQDLHAKGGFAGRERGTANIGRNLVAKYLDNVQGKVLGDLAVDREVINCDLVVMGGINMPNGTIIGGNVIATNQVRIATLGSNGNVPTYVTVGAVPSLEKPLADLRDLLRQLEEIEHEFSEQQRMLGINNRPNAEEKERMCEIMFELDAARGSLNKARMVAERLGQRISDKRLVDVNVDRMLFTGTRLCIGQVCYRVMDDVKGPMSIELARGTELRYRQGQGKPKALSHIADVETMAA